MTIIRIGPDTSKHVFQIHGVDENEQPVLRRQIRRSGVAKFFAKLPATQIGIEACGTSHHWARLLHSLGHEVVLIPRNTSSFTSNAARLMQSMPRRFENQ
jgi:transposase